MLRLKQDRMPNSWKENEIFKEIEIADFDYQLDPKFEGPKLWSANKKLGNLIQLRLEEDKMHKKMHDLLLKNLVMKNLVMNTLSMENLVLKIFSYFWTPFMLLDMKKVKA